MLLLAGVEQESGRTQSAEQQEGSSVLENMIREAGAEEVVKLPLDGVRHSPHAAHNRGATERARAWLV